MLKTLVFLLCVSASLSMISSNADEVESGEVCSSSQAACDAVDWWKKTNFYHIYLRSFQDSDGDGNGDLRGVMQRLDYLQKIGVETILMAPFYSSPMRDCGYDIDDYLGINPMFGTMQDFEDMVAAIKRRGMYLVVDFVPNHSSNKHYWFKCSEKAYLDPEKCGHYKDYYVWRKPTVDPQTGEPQLDKPPTNWISVFGGSPAWTYSTVRKEWYLHQFLPEQPDLNFRNPQVREEFKDIARFWLRKGADGLRVDSAIHLMEDPEWRDEPLSTKWKQGDDPYFKLDHKYTRSLSESAAIVKDWRDVMNEPEFLDKKTGKTTKIIITEAYDEVPKLIEYYGTSPDNKYADMPFNFQLFFIKELNWSPIAIENFTLAWLKPVKELGWPKENGAISPWSCWVTGNHDNSRMVNRVGFHNAIVYQWLSYMLPGVPINYSGDELHIHDANFNKIPHKTIQEGEPTRLPFRAPMAWTDDDPSGGFSSTADIWMPLNSDFKINNVKRLMANPFAHANPLRMFLKLQEIRKTNLALFLFGDLIFFSSHGIKKQDAKVLALARISSNYGNILLLANCDQFNKVTVRLDAGESLYEGQRVEPPKRGNLLTFNYETTATTEDESPSIPSRAPQLKDAEINIDGLELMPSQALLIKF